MRLAVLAPSTFALCLTPLCAQSVNADLREEIRRIVREEIRAALKEAHTTQGLEVFTKDESGLPTKAVRVVPVQKIEVAPVETIEVAPAEKIKVVTPENLKAKSDGGNQVTVHVLDGNGKPVETKVYGTGRVTAKTLDSDGTVHLLFDDGQTKTIVVTPDQLKHRVMVDAGKTTPTEHQVEVEVVGTEAELKEVRKAVGECCEALEKCCEAVGECKVEKVEGNPRLVEIDDVTTGKQNEEAGHKGAKKAKKAEKKKAKKQKQEHENSGGV
jgi:hypothetical protein